MTDRLDPLETSRQIEESYKRYLKTLLSPRDGKLAEAFDAEIDATSMLTKGPMLELTPPYETGATPRQLVEQGVLHPDFAADRHSRGSAAVRPSGNRDPQVPRRTQPGRQHRHGIGQDRELPRADPQLACSRNGPTGTLGPGVRALLLYPMNALANDQLKRLRSILRSVPDITFGRYTGETLTKPTRRGKRLPAQQSG